ncbi:hypothetical protein A4X13_0g5207 [Tilletia indica]|uniref:Major facilitator superfamily (MFS) profile domain-containing protein n=1 Tax=Tilletia indica TaxID=43049 RepID=A0A8T8SUE5_9BASI|nr:hypothetical protein A4X13_0g5207 [Tilletia indica]
MDDDGMILNLAPLPLPGAPGSKGKGKSAAQRNSQQRNKRQHNQQQPATNNDDPPAKKQRVDHPPLQPQVTADPKPAQAPAPAPASSAPPRTATQSTPSTSSFSAPSRPQPKTFISSLFPRPLDTDTAKVQDDEEEETPKTQARPTNAPSVSGPITFESLQLHPLLVQHLTTRMQVLRPTAIQRRAFPSLLQAANTQQTLYPSKSLPTLHHDLMIHSQTGSGKTLTYLLPILHHLLPLSQESFINRSIGTLAIVLAPTRELARQIYDVLERILSMSLHLPESQDKEEDQRHYSRWLVPCLLTGGATRTHEKMRLRKGCPIIVSTPGRLLDHLQNTTTLDVGKLQWLILDEADRLMDLGFEEALRDITQILESRRKVAVSKARIAVLELENEDQSESEDEQMNQEEGYGFGDARPKKNLKKKFVPTGANANSVWKKAPQIPEAELADSLGIHWWKIPRRTVLCSATLDESVQALAGATLRDPIILKPTAEDEKAAQEAEREAKRTAGTYQKQDTAAVIASSSGAADGTSSGIPSTAKFLAPAQLAQHFIVVPPKLRLVTLLALLRSSVRSEATPTSKGRENRVIVFLSCTDSVDFHWDALGGAKMGGYEEHEIQDEAEDEETEESDEDDSPGKKKGSQAKNGKGKGKGQPKTIEEQVTRHSDLLPGVPIFRLHGSMTQAERVASLKAFSGRGKKTKQQLSEPLKGAVLLCTSVASRGLDLPSMRTVIQLDAPTEGGVEEYVHRIGRTARVGNRGESWLILLESERAWVNTLESGVGVEGGLAGGGGVSRVKVHEEKVEKVLLRGFGGKAADSEYEARATDVQLAFERWVLAGEDSAALARKAYMSHIRAYATHPAAEKHIFHTRFLHLGHLAKAFALREAPTAIKKHAHAPKAAAAGANAKSGGGRASLDAGGGKRRNSGTFQKQGGNRRGARTDDEGDNDDDDFDLRPQGKPVSTPSQLRQLAAHAAAAASATNRRGASQQGTKETDAEARMYAKVRAMGKASKKGGVLGAFGGADEFQIGTRLRTADAASLSLSSPDSAAHHFFLQGSEPYLADDKRQEEAQINTEPLRPRLFPPLSSPNPNTSSSASLSQTSQYQRSSSQASPSSHYRLEGENHTASKNAASEYSDEEHDDDDEQVNLIMGGAAMMPSSNGPVVGDTNVFSKANSRPVLLCAVAVIGAVLYGYDGTYFAGILAMKRFLEDFGSLQPNGRIDVTSSQRSLLASIVQAGEVVGSLAAAPIGDFFGRRGVYFGACSQVVLGAIIQLVTTSSIGVLTGGRFVLGVGIGLISNSTPLYLSEIAPTPIRGVIVSCWQLFLAIGQVIGACVAQGTKGLESTASYRIPIAINIGIVAIIATGIWLVPESPRWLINKDRDEDAKRALRRINKTQLNPAAVVEAEYATFVAARNNERELAQTQKGGWMELLRNPVERRKFLLVLGVLASQQIGGVQFIFSYTTTFFRDVGVDNEFMVTIVVDVIEVAGVLVSFPLVARYGRRPLLLLTSIPMFIALFVMAALGTIDGRTQLENRVIAACICIYVFAFNAAWGPLAWVCASELAGSGRNRQKVMSVGTALFWIIAFVVTFTLPYLFDQDKAGLGPQIGWIYGCGTLIAMFFVYFFLPETFGRSLESINEMLDAKVPARKWTTFSTDIETQAKRNHADADVNVREGSNGTPDDASEADESKGKDSGSDKGDRVHIATETA